MKILTFLFLTTALATADSHFYDDADRLVRTVHRSGQTVVYTYDDADNLLSVANATAPAAPGSISAERTTQESATIDWTDIASNETGYRIERRPDTGYQWEVITPDLPANSTTFTDSDLTPADSYVYRVYAISTGNLTSAYSAEALATGAGSERITIRSLTHSADSRPEVRFEAEAGATYLLESSPDLTNWESSTFSITPNGSFLSELTGVNGTTAIYLPALGSELPAPGSDAIFFRLIGSN